MPDATEAIDKARVEATVQALLAAVDVLEFDAAARCFAASVALDYTSLFGGEPQTLTPQGVVGPWRGLLPGFDATRHVLSDITAEIHGATATASARVVGTHWLADATWIVGGRYAFELRRAGPRWLISRMTLHADQEAGERDLARQASERVAAGLPRS